MDKDIKITAILCGTLLAGISIICFAYTIQCQTKYRTGLEMARLGAQAVEAVWGKD